MNVPPPSPGKTAPKLHHDLLNFDPLRNGRGNVLTDCTKPGVDGPSPAIGSCQHEYTTKSKQSVPPPLDLRPDGSTKYKLAVVCKKCRIHVDVKIDYACATNPCPNSDYPLHHFRHLEEDESTASRITYHWQCSAPQCQAHLQISFRTARISNKEKDLLMNTELLKRRYEAVVADDPSREGVRQANPMEALSRLKKYVSDSQRPDRQRHAFPADNKRFMEAFGVRGQDCRELLEGYGFRYANDEGLWYLPTPPPVVDRLEADGSTLRELLEDVEIELTAWFYKTAAETNLPNPAAMDGWPSANRDLERTLAAQGYQRYAAPGLRSNNTSELLPYLSGLGILPDFADSLVEFAYERQTTCDPDRTSYYFECLQVIAENRPNSESLSMKVAVLESKSVISSRDIRAAYRALGINSVEEGAKADDQRLINLFQVRKQDSGPALKEELRHALYKLGTARGSKTLMNMSQQNIETVDDALSFLGPPANRDTDDDMLIAIYASKVAENTEDEVLAQKALSVIARERKSEKLNNFVAGHSNETTMDIKEAFVHLGNSVENPDEVQPEVLDFMFSDAREQKPGDQTEKAIKVIQDYYSGRTSKRVDPASWPVGLKSRGNTCYLNSLLQYYFAIKPIREIVLNYDKYKLPVTKDTVKTEHVGMLPITHVELVGNQRFATLMQRLFERMIKEPTGEVQPGGDLVCRAFLKAADHELLSSDAPMTDESAEAGGAKGADAALGPETTQQNGGADTNGAGQDSMASTQTLQGDNQGEDTQMADGDQPSALSESQQDESTVSTNGGDAGAKPPLPPRHSISISTKEELLEKAQDSARNQQDVAEVHDGIIHRLRGGMKADGTDERGEQRDSLRALADCRTSEVVVDEHGVYSKPKQTWQSALTLSVPTEDTDINSALDDVFALQPRRNSNAKQETFTSLVSAPPLLQLNMPRNNYSIEIGAFKSKDLMRLEDEIYLDRYFENPDILPKRQRCWGWRTQLKALKQEQKRILAGAENLDGPGAVSAAADYVNIIKDINGEIQDLDIEGLGDIDDDLPKALASESAQMKERLPSLNAEIEDLERKLRAEFDAPEFKTKKYRLAAVFMHRGESGGGHYWVFIHDFGNDMWRKYNDEKVTEVPASELQDAIFEAKGEKYSGYTAEAATPTYAVYVASDKLEYVQPVCRQPEALPTPPASVNQDVEMVSSSDWNNAQSQSTHDPTKTVQEGEPTSWDTPRQVADVSW